MAVVKLKLREVLARFGSINKLREAPKVRAKLAFALACLAGQATSVVRQFEDARAGRQRAFSVKNEKGEFEIPADKRAELAEEIEELLDEEVTIQAAAVEIPGNFEMDGLVAVLSDWPDFLVVKD